LNYIILFIIALVSGSFNTFDESFDTPSIKEKKIFQELLEKFLKTDIGKIDVSGILGTFEKPFIKTFACNSDDVNELVVNVVETRIGGFSVAEELETGVILGGTYTWQCKITTSEKKVITIDCDNTIKLNPDVITTERRDSRVHDIENSAIFYHELLHGQLMLDAISISEKWRNDVCNKTPSDSIDLSYSDKDHNVIGPLQTVYTKKLVSETGGVFINEKIIPKETLNGKFSKKVISRLDMPQFDGKGILVTYRAFNIDEPLVTFQGNDIIFSGKLKNISNPGDGWLYIFDELFPTPQVVEQIPQWIKKNAEWWSKGTITDSDFLRGIEYLIQNEILKIEANQINSSKSSEIPLWIRNNAEWWSTGLISDDEFLAGIKYLIEVGIIAYQ
jgi:hypothetical protein